MKDAEGRWLLGQRGGGCGCSASRHVDFKGKTDEQISGLLGSRRARRSFKCGATSEIAWRQGTTFARRGRPSPSRGNRHVSAT